MYATPPDDPPPSHNIFTLETWSIVFVAVLYGAILDEAVNHGNWLARVLVLLIPAVLYFTGAFR